MNIENVISQINNGSSPRIGFYFGLFIQNLLKIHLEKQGKDFTVEYPISKYKLDGYSKDGIDQYEGPVAFEVKYFRHPTSLMVKSVVEQMTHILNLTEIKYIIIICPTVTDRMREVIQNENPKFILWGTPEINKLIEINKEKAENIANSLFKLEIEKELKREDNDWKKSREELLTSIKKSYKKGNFSLLLGAGVSCSAGLPNWGTLLNSLYANFVNKTFNDDVIENDTIEAITDKFIEINNSSTLAVARYLKAGLSQKDDDALFLSAVKEALYNSPKTSSLLIESITNLCIPKRSGAKVKSIITYNFDDLIEESLDKVKLEYKTIHKDEEQHDSDELPIYHVHGFIPSRGEIDKDVSLIFSEEAYHKVYSEPYHWSNLVQLATLRENNCLMIGLSLSDPNLRRLLEIAAQKQSKNSKHYAFIQRISNNNFIDDTSKVKIDEVSANKILRTHHVIQEKMMESLGTKVIWFEDYSEIPTLLDIIRK